MSEERIKEINRQIIFIQMLAMPGVFLFGIGLYALFTPSGEAFMEILNIKAVQYGLIGFGAITLIVEIRFMIPLLIEIAKFRRESDS